jgi:hypothetical protein
LPSGIIADKSTFDSKMLVFFGVCCFVYFGFSSCFGESRLVMITFGSYSSCPKSELFSLTFSERAAMAASSVYISDYFSYLTTGFLISYY